MDFPPTPEQAVQTLIAIIDARIFYVYPRVNDCDCTEIDINSINFNGSLMAFSAKC